MVGLRGAGGGQGSNSDRQSLGWGWTKIGQGQGPRGGDGGALHVHSPEAPIVLPSSGVKADVFLQCLAILVMGGNVGI